jgi:hypothetical protein
VSHLQPISAINSVNDLVDFVVHSGALPALVLAATGALAYFVKSYATWLEWRFRNRRRVQQMVRAFRTEIESDVKGYAQEFTAETKKQTDGAFRCK